MLPACFIYLTTKKSCHVWDECIPVEYKDKFNIGQSSKLLVGGWPKLFISVFNNGGKIIFRIGRGSTAYALSDIIIFL